MKVRIADFHNLICQPVVKMLPLPELDNLCFIHTMSRLRRCR